MCYECVSRRNVVWITRRSGTATTHIPCVKRWRTLSGKVGSVVEFSTSDHDGAGKKTVTEVIMVDICLDFNMSISSPWESLWCFHCVAQNTDSWNPWLFMITKNILDLSLKICRQFLLMTQNPKGVDKAPPSQWLRVQLCPLRSLFFLLTPTHDWCISSYT